MVDGGIELVGPATRAQPAERGGRGIEVVDGGIKVVDGGIELVGPATRAQPAERGWRGNLSEYGHHPGLIFLCFPIGF